MHPSTYEYLKPTDDQIEHANEEDVEAVAEAIELVESHSAEHYARAAIAALESRGWKREKE